MAPNPVCNLQGGNHLLKASRENVKMKTPEGEVKMAVLGDSPGTEESNREMIKLSSGVWCPSVCKKFLCCSFNTVVFIL